MKKHYDVIIIGTGISGLYTALNLNEKLNILIVSKKDINLSNSSLAQGGIAAVIDNKNDSKTIHYNDTLIAGGMTNNKESVKILVDQGPSEVLNIIKLGVNFDKEDNEKYHLTLEGGHSKRRIFHYKDSTGKEIIEKLSKQVLNRSNITLIENTILYEIKKINNYFYFKFLKSDEHISASSTFCVLSTGGIGNLFNHTTNSEISTGDGIYFAHKLGAKIKNLSLIQFHPTVFITKSKNKSFLISEAVRGEGAYLLNSNFERFMHKYDERLELAPRDIVSQSILKEAKLTNLNNFYIDISHKDKRFIKDRFPKIYNTLLQENYDLTKDKIPIFPAQHYLMGGIDVDSNSISSIDNLYAVGECSYTGVHGNNRLASNSLLEGLVFSKRAANHINENSYKCKENNIYIKVNIDKKSKHIPIAIIDKIKFIMENTIFVTLNKEYVNQALEKINEIISFIENEEFIIDKNYIEARSLATIAKLIIKEVI